MYNSYFNNQYTNPNQYYGYQPMQMTQRQTPVQPQEEKLFTDVRFVTEEEAKGYIMFPNTKVMLVDRDKSIFYIKSADSIGKTTLEGYKYTKLEENSTEPVSCVLDSKEYVKTSDLENYLSNFLTRNDIKDFITKEDLKNILSENKTEQN